MKKVLALSQDFFIFQESLNNINMLMIITPQVITRIVVDFHNPSLISQHFVNRQSGRVARWQDAGK